MKYDFDKVIDRKGTDSLKFDTYELYGIPEDAMSLWVADMDFSSADPVKEAIKEAADKGIFGYTMPQDGYYSAVTGWFKEHFDWDIEKRSLVVTEGVVYALATAVKAYTKPGDKVLIQRPVYYPFTSVIENNGRVVVNSPLKEDSLRYEMDFCDLKDKLQDEDVKMFILCSPHNPVGRVWSRDELVRVADLCLENDVLLVSDEIHSDFVWGDNIHTPVLSIDKKYEKNVIACTAPSKTFNLAGLNNSNIMIPDRGLRHKYRKEMQKTGGGSGGKMGVIACEAAYTEGEEWLRQVKEYIYENIEWMYNYLNKEVPSVHMFMPEGTYLVWVDLRSLGMKGDDLKDFILNEAHLWLDMGDMFGKEGDGFIRINAACPRDYLKQAVMSLKHAIEERRS